MVIIIDLGKIELPFKFTVIYILRLLLSKSVWAAIMKYHSLGVL